jgi:DNA polymerase III delta prime subunit
MEEFSNNCGFILTCNFKNRIINPLHSRCSVVDFNIPKDEKMKLASQFLNRINGILVHEDVDFDKKVVAELITKYFPDWRRVINELQRYSATGKVDSGILANNSEASIVELIKHLKAKSFTEMRKWVAHNSDIDTTTLFRKLYDISSTEFKQRSIPQLVVLMADYQHKAAFVADQEINIVAFFTEVMSSCEFE